METSVYREIMALDHMTSGELKRKYLEVFGERARSGHKDFLRKKIAWRIQALAEGGLSERARRRALEIANDADLRVRLPRVKVDEGNPHIEARTITSKINSSPDSRLPIPGTLLVREFKGVTHVVRTLDDGFEYDNRRFKSLSAIAREITGTKWNGFVFFGITRQQGKKKDENGK